ncbi:TPA: phosphoribosylformylglycinamidine synthase I [Candidatus Acetothermia bacterium]|nr:phosphoribosylformylglycinamidine synthase I [Candidatus Acetothermia bacterium]
MDICVLVMEGTNNEAETSHCLTAVGLTPHIVTVRELITHKYSLHQFKGLVIPGGFSAGDYVRSGAIFAAYLRPLLADLRSFITNGWPVLGICNGFQILVELGVLPDCKDSKETPEPTAILTRNSSARFECRTVLLRCEQTNLFTRGLKQGEILELPAAHAEGRFVASAKILEEITTTGQVAFRYVGPPCTITVHGPSATAEYPYNPNGSLSDIAGLGNQQGNVLGIMPHPERAFYWYQQAGWTRRQKEQRHGSGYALFAGMAAYLQERR